MNNQLEEFARNTIAEGLYKLSSEQNKLFKMMYGRAEGERSIEDTLAMDLEDVINEVPSHKLDWAMTQVENSVNKLED